MDSGERVDQLDKAAEKLLSDKLWDRWQISCIWWGLDFALQGKVMQII